MGRRVVLAPNAGVKSSEGFASAQPGRAQPELEQAAIISASSKLPLGLDCNPGLRDKPHAAIGNRDSNPFLALLAKAEIACGHARIGGDVLGRAVEDEFTEFHHIGAVGDLQRGFRILFDQQYRDAA